MCEYIVAVEYRLKGMVTLFEDYMKCATLDEAKEQVEWYSTRIKPHGELFDIAIYEVTNY